MQSQTTSLPVKSHPMHSQASVPWQAGHVTHSACLGEDIRDSKMCGIYLHTLEPVLLTCHKLVGSVFLGNLNACNIPLNALDASEHIPCLALS